MATSSKSSSNKLKEFLSACRSSFKRKGYKKDLAASFNVYGVNNFVSRQNNSENSSIALGSYASVASSVNRNLRALSQSSSEDNVPDDRLQAEENINELNATSSEKKLNTKQLNITLKSSKDESNSKQFDILSKSNVKQLDGYVGFANLPNQIYWRAVKKGFEFTLMVVGQSGLGKSTLINSMFLTDIYNSTDYPGPTLRSKKTVSVEATTVNLKESGVKLALTVIDTPGFGDAVNNVGSWTPIVNFIESKHEAYLRNETRINRTVLSDERVHCCLYFIQPTGHGLKSLDIEFLKRLHDKVNIVPIIAKADTLTKKECDLFKKQIMREIAEHDIKIYEFPDISEEDEEYQLNNSLRDKVPFAVVGSNTLIEINGKTVRGRKYPWGVVDIENMEQCDFTALRTMVVCTHMQDLKDVTHFVHYENYRRHALLSSERNSGKYLSYNSFLERNNEKLEHDSKIQKATYEMQQIFDSKLREKMKVYEHRKVEMTRRYENATKNLEQQGKDLAEKYRQFVLEKEAWESERQTIVEKLWTVYANDRPETKKLLD